MIELSNIEYAIHIKPVQETDWLRKYNQLEQWCNENIINKVYVAKPKPQERIFIFENQEDAMAFRLAWDT